MKYKLLVLSLLCSIIAYAQPREVTVVATGDGSTKEEATNNALRSAVEQAFGVFVSANTEILNDEITKDEVATVSSGNIKSFEVNAYTEGLDGVKTVTVSAVISLGKLIEYTANHGHSTEFAGSTFGANVKLYELNRAATVKALKHLYYTLSQLLPKMYDYKLTVKDPSIDLEKNIGTIEMTVDFLANNNTQEIVNYFTNTILALAATHENAETLSQNGMVFYAYYSYPFKNTDKSKEWFYIFKPGNAFRKSQRVDPIYLYAPIDNALINWLFLSSLFDFKIMDNLGNQYLFHLSLPKREWISFFDNLYECNFYSISGGQWTHSYDGSYFEFSGDKRIGMYSCWNKEQIRRDCSLNSAQFGGIITAGTSYRPGSVVGQLTESITIPREDIFKITQFQIVPDDKSGCSKILEYACNILLERCFLPHYEREDPSNKARTIYKFSLATGLTIPDDILKRIEDYIEEDPFDNQRSNSSKK